MANEREDKIIKNIINTQTWLASRRSRWESTWREIGREISPLRMDIYQDEPQGEKRYDDIYDGTAQLSLDVHVNGIFGNFISPTDPWFRLGMSNQDLNDLRDVRMYLQSVEEQLYATINASNFYDEFFLLIQDGATIGTAPLYIEEDFERGGIVAMAIHPGETFLSHNDKNVIDVFHRKIKFTLKQIISKFGVDAVPEDLILSAEENPFSERTVIHAVYKREDYDPFKFDSINKPFASIWILTGQSAGSVSTDKGFQGQQNTKGAKSEDVILKESGFDTMPYMVWRPYRDTREEYGRSPAMRALPDAMALNIIGKTLLGVAERAAEPPAVVPAELEGMADFGARGINYVTNTENAPVFMEVSREYPIARDREEDKRASVRQAFNVDFFIALSASGSQTATEVIAKEGEKAVILMSSITRLQVTASAALERIFQIENEAGRMPVPPEILRGGEDVGITFLGPLAQVQSRLFQTRGINQTMFDLGPVVQLFGEEPLRNFDADVIAREIAQANAFPAKGIVPKKEVEEGRQQALELAQQQAQQAELAQQADTAGKLAKADKDSEGGLTEALASGAEG